MRKTLAATAALLVAFLTSPDGHAAIPGWWLQQAACIRAHEGWWTANTGNGYYGAYQFLLSTWRSVGGRGYPHQASPAEQTYRAWILWNRSGGSWSAWGTRSACGLR